MRLEIFNPRAERIQNETEIRYEIINVLTKEKGKHTVEELRIRLDKKFGSDM